MSCAHIRSYGMGGRSVGTAGDGADGSGDRVRCRPCKLLSERENHAGFISSDLYDRHQRSEAVEVLNRQ